MKILVIINNLTKGGAEKMVVQTISEFQKRGLQAEILQLSAKYSHPDYQEAVVKAGAVLHDLGCNSVYSFSIIRKLRKFVKNRQYDLVQVHLFPAQYWAAFALRSLRTPLVFTEHSTFNRRWGKFYFRYLDLLTYNKYTSIIAITDDVKQALTNWIPAIGNKVVVINNGINIQAFSDCPVSNRNLLLAELGIADSSARLLLMTARFEWPKKHQVLIQALRRLPADVHLLFAGDGSFQPALEKQAAEAGLQNRVHFLGFRADAPSLMKTADINILSTDFEGLSTVTVEALAAGKPFLGSDVTGINNVIPDKRFLFEAGNEQELIDKIKAILSGKDLAAEMVADMKQYLGNYDIKLMIDKHLALFKEILEKRG
jgi:glycosyltransferase involved in cell wall biosynthesis